MRYKAARLQAVPAHPGTRAVHLVGGPMWLKRLRMGSCCAAFALGGCSSDEAPSPPASQPAAAVSATQPAQPPASQPEPELSPLLPQSESWSREEALAKLASDATCVSAAVRLVRLARAAPLCVPDPLAADVARRLRVVALSESLWALGWGMPDERCLRLPVLIDGAGEVTLPLEGVEEEVALLCWAEDAEFFPHLLITPERVLIVGEELQSALVTRSPAGLTLRLRNEDGYPYVALLWHGPWVAEDGTAMPAGGEPLELARYRWDPWELAFLGPLSDRLPDPPGGLFELDLEQSEALIPIGGVIPEPPPIETPPPAEGEPTPY